MIFLFFHIGVLMVCDRMIQQIGQEQFVSVFMCASLEKVYLDQKKRKYEWSQSFKIQLRGDACHIVKVSERPSWRGSGEDQQRDLVVWKCLAG